MVFAVNFDGFNVNRVNLNVNRGVFCVFSVFSVFGPVSPSRSFLSVRNKPDGLAEVVIEEKLRSFREEIQLDGGSCGRLGEVAAVSVKMRPFGRRCGRLSEVAAVSVRMRPFERGCGRFRKKWKIWQTCGRFSKILRFRQTSL